MFQDESYGSNREQRWKNDYWRGVFNSKEMFTSVQNGELTEFYSRILICELTVKPQQPLDSPWVADFSLV